METIIYQASFSIKYSNGEIRSKFVVVNPTISLDAHSHEIYSEAWVGLFAKIKVDLSSIQSISQLPIEEIKLNTIIQISSLDKKGNPDGIYFKRRVKRKKKTTPKKKTNRKGKSKKKTQKSSKIKKKTG